MGYRFHQSFYYHMKLHYSQTMPALYGSDRLFYYHMELHYSQTITQTGTAGSVFYYHMKLHYSQTCQVVLLIYFLVLLSYEITLLSN